MYIIWLIIYFIILVLGIAIGTYRFHKLSISGKYLLLLIIITLISEAIANFISNSGNSNFLVYHIFTPIQYLIVSITYYLETKSKHYIYTIIPIITLGIILSIWVQPLPKFNSYFLSVELFMFTIFVISYLRLLLKEKSYISLINYPFFWISCGLILFSVSNLFIFGIYNMVDKVDPLIYSVFRYVRYFTNYLFYSLIAFSFLIKQNTISENHAD